MNFHFVNHYAHPNSDMWPAHPMQGVFVYPVQDGLLVPRPATRRCSPAPEVINLVNVPVEVIDLMDDDSSTATAVIDLMDDDSSSETVHPPMVEGEDLSLGSMSKVSDSDVKDMDDWETLTDTFVSEPSTSVVVRHGDSGSSIVTGREDLIWDGGSLSFLDCLTDSAMPTDFGDDDISAIVEQADTQFTAAIGSRGVFIDAEKLHGCTFVEREVPTDVSDDDDDDSVVFLKVSHPDAIAPAPVDDLNRNASCSFFDRPTRMVSLDSETPCIVDQPYIEACAVVEAPDEEFELDESLLSSTFNANLVVPWENCNAKQSAIFQDAIAPHTNDHDFPMADFKW